VSVSIIFNYYEENVTLREILRDVKEKIEVYKQKFSIK
jgi:hypothetical protein